MSFPIYPDKQTLPAMLTADKMIQFRRQQGGLKGVAPPRAVILCLYTGVMKYFGLKHRSRRVGGFLGNLFLLNRRRGQLGVMGNFGIGSPVVASLAEELAAWGCRRLILFALAGGLQPDLLSGSIVLAERAIRDEGTSYHYLPPGKYVEGSSALVADIVGALAKRGLEHRTGTVWSTDAPYRETREEAAQFRSEGAQAVDMESAGLFTVGRVRGVDTASVLVIGDSLAHPEWSAPPDMRALHRKLKLVFGVLLDSL